MKNTNALLTLVVTVVIAVLAINFLSKGPASYAADQPNTDTTTVGATVNAAIGVSDATASITPSVATADATITNEGVSSIKVYSNEPGGFTLKVGVADLDTSPTADQLCNDTIAGGGCDNTDYFATDGDADSSYIKLTSADTGGAITGETLATAALMSGAVTVVSTADNQQIDAAVIGMDWDFFADYVIVAQTYEGTLTFTITATP